MAKPNRKSLGKKTVTKKSVEEVDSDTTTNGSFKPPKGYKIMEVTEDKFPPAHDFDVEKTLEGKVIEIKTVEIEDGERRVMLLATTVGLRCLWESYMLTQLFDTVKKGKMVLVHYRGKKKIKGRKTMRIYESFVK